MPTASFDLTRWNALHLQRVERALGGVAGKRPDRATLVYIQRCKEAYKDVPIIIGGIDLSSGSVVGATAMIAMSFAQVALVNGNPNPKAIFMAEGWVDLPVIA